MTFRVTLAGIVWLLSLGSAAHAGEVGAGPVFHKNQAIASCTVVNFNARPVQITMQILSSDGSPVSITFNNCAGRQLRTDQVCVMNAKLSSQSILYFCKVGSTFSTGAEASSAIRGSLMIYDSAQNFLSASEIH